MAAKFDASKEAASAVHLAGLEGNQNIFTASPAAAPAPAAPKPSFSMDLS